MNTEDFEAELLVLKHELYQARKINLEQELRITVLIKENKSLHQEIKSLQTQPIKIQDKLNINSSNSGLPTSLEVSLLERKLRPRSGRRAGGQFGHRGKDMKPK